MMDNIQAGRTYLVNYAPDMRVIARVIAYDPEWGYAECLFGEFKFFGTAWYAELDKVGVISDQLFEDAIAWNWEHEPHFPKTIRMHPATWDEITRIE